MTANWAAMAAHEEWHCDAANANACQGWTSVAQTTIVAAIGAGHSTGVTVVADAA